ncbi:MAG: hypothetical protein ACJ8IQ_05595 [Chthoniobacterales bacterium]
MSFRKPLLILCACLAVVAIVVLIAAPLITATMVRLWIANVARTNECTISYAAIEAPLLRPVTLRDVTITSTTKAVAVKIARVAADLRVAAFFDNSRGRPVRTLSLDDVAGNCGAAPSPRTLQFLLADNFAISVKQLTVQSATTTAEIHDAELTARELESGTFHLRRLVVRSPALQQTFDDLRGGTSWEYNRFSLGGVTMMRGLDVDVLRVDLGRLGENRIGIDADLDVFGGKLRASMSAEEQTGKRTWDIAASGNEISLARMSDALAFSDRASGSLHALKFTFRGSLETLQSATASLWTEITGFTWRDRTADVVMLGASYSSRQIDVEQLYVKQRRNELTLTGELALPARNTELPDLRGDVSATIGDLADFARLLGGSPANFAGQLAINGSATAQERSLAGQLVVSGKSLKLFGAPIDAVDAHMLLSRSALELDRCELRRDSANLPPLSIRGGCDFSDNNAVSATLRFDQPLVFQAAAGNCITGVRLADSPADQSSAAVPFTSLEFSGPLFRAGWSIAAHDGDASAQTFSFCTQHDVSGGALVVAPAR